MKEVLYCAVCGRLIPFGKMHVVFPKLVQYSDPEKIEFETWCDKCRDSFYEMYNLWKVKRALSEAEKNIR